MANVVDPKREKDLRKRMGVALSFADLVRETHQDEIEQKFSEPSWTAPLARQFGPQSVFDAVKIAKHHRFHSLREAPEDLRDPHKPGTTSASAWGSWPTGSPGPPKGASCAKIKSRPTAAPPKPTPMTPMPGTPFVDRS